MRIADEAIISVNEAQESVLFNEGAEDIFGYRRQEVLGKPLDILLPRRFVKAHSVHIQKFTTSPTISRMMNERSVIYGLRRNGTEFPAEASISKLESGDEKLFTVILRDITERMLTEKQIKASREQLRNLATRLQSVREEEKTRISRDIHDILGQELTGLKINLGWLGQKLSQLGDVVPRSLQEQITHMSERVGTTIQTVQGISTEMRPAVLDALGLIAAIEWQAQEFQTRLGIRCKFTSSPENFTLDQNRSTEMFRIFQETLTNVARHANATRVNISLKKNARDLILKVRDNGKGITESEISDPKSLGLLGMRERAIVLGGELKISGTPGKGTTATIRIPLKR